MVLLRLGVALRRGVWLLQPGVALRRGVLLLQPGVALRRGVLLLRLGVALRRCVLLLRRVGLRQAGVSIHECIQTQTASAKPPGVSLAEIGLHQLIIPYLLPFHL